MKLIFNLRILAVTFMLISVSCNSQNELLKPESAIIPAPESVVLSGEFSNLTKIVFSPDTIWYNSYSDNLLQLTNLPQEKNQNINQSTLLVSLSETLGKESYLIEITDDNIRITASDRSGVQYALTSLGQLVKFNNGKIPLGIIKDNPKFRYRGMHLDVARHFFSVAEVKKYLDYMAFYKFNNFHWHLTEDQGWRIEIKKYPKLQEIAAFRKETLIGHYSDKPHKFDGKRYGGYYTQDEIKEVVAYAAERNINVIPEIEMPGHAQAALAAYPELGCGPGPYEVATKWGIFEDVFCPNEVTFKFLEDVIDEVISLFPGKYIHIGGDECPKEAWKKSKFCQDLIRKNGLKDEHELQSYFITRMEKYINSKGKQIIGWDEILEGGLAPNATVMSWRGISGGLEAARSGHDVIMTPGTHCYFDHYQSESQDEPIAIGGYTSVEKVFHWDPIPSELEEDKRKYILGGQANVWTEYIPVFSHVEYMAYARGMAMSEALWRGGKDYSEFLKRFDIHVNYWKNKGANIAYHVFDLKPVIKAGEGNPVSLSFTVPSGALIHHKINDVDTPVKASGENIVIEKAGRHTFQAVRNETKGKALKLDFDLHLGTTAKVSIDPAPSKKYFANGPGSIVNGITGSDEKYGGTEWLGFEGTDATVTLDFGKEVNFVQVHCRFFRGEGQWIYLPPQVDILISTDGTNFEKVTGISNIGAADKIGDINFDLGSTRARYLRVFAKNYGVIPSGAQGAGHKAWLFMDEINVR
ncbi:MAG: beta-N-acetylhexosaminidase [Saprospiraceae bacterium]|nr:beta-N-acetylhexosaminidase [Saprospiraceae bacterium]